MRRFFLAAVAVVCMIAAPIFTENIATAAQIDYNAPAFTLPTVADVPVHRVRFCDVTNFVDRTPFDPSSQKAADDPAPRYNIRC